MSKRSKLANPSKLPPAPVAPGSGVVPMVEGLLAFLNGHQGDRIEGVHALLIAFVQAAVQVLDECDRDEIDANRDALLAMLEHARRVLGDSPAAPQARTTWTIH
jgi:hypothetical protein